MVITESLMKDNYSIPVVDSPEKAEENGSAPEKAEENGSAPEKAEENGIAPEKAEENGIAPEKAEENGSTPEKAEENGSTPEKPSFTPPSTKRISESPIKENLAPAATPTTADYGVTQLRSRWSSFSSSKRSFGSSKDESFFDSHQWLQSDSEDDFYSVNGEFTPSRGSTPNCSFSEKLPRFHNPLFEEEKPRVSFSQFPAPPRRKKLGELFRDSIREQREVIFEESSESPSEKSKKSSGDNSGELRVIEDSENDKSSNNHHRCLPRFSAFKGSLMEKKKKKKKKKKTHTDIALKL